MNIKTINENIGINRLILQKEENFVVESDEIVPDIKPDVLNIISTSGNVCIQKKEILDGKVKFDGTVDIYTIYIAEDEKASVRCMNSNLKFSKTIDTEKNFIDIQLDQTIKIKSIDAKVLNGRKINLKVDLDTIIYMYTNENVEILKEIEDINDLQKLNKEYSINSLIGKGSTSIYAKETVKIDKLDNLLEIMNVKTSIINQETKTSYNKVLDKADFIVKIAYLTEDNRINVVSTAIPIMGFIDIPNVKENDICNINYQLKSLNIKPNNIDEHSIYIDAEIENNCAVYENKNIQIIQDLYSPTVNLKYKQNSIKIIKNQNKIKQTFSINKQEVIQDIGENKIYDVEVNPIIVNKRISQGGIYYDGEVNLTFLFGENTPDGRIKSKTIVEPFNFNIDNYITNEAQIETNIDVIRQNCTIRPDKTIDVVLDLELNVLIQQIEEIKIINMIEKDENTEKQTHSVVIYYTKVGDTLWNIAKKFGSTIEDIVKINNMEKENKLMPGEQLFIPR